MSLNTVFSYILEVIYARKGPKGLPVSENDVLTALSIVLGNVKNWKDDPPVSEGELNIIHFYVLFVFLVN